MSGLRRATLRTTACWCMLLIFFLGDAWGQSDQSTGAKAPKTQGTGAGILGQSLPGAWRPFSDDSPGTPPFRTRLPYTP